jgi:hypothetical protein
LKNVNSNGCNVVASNLTPKGLNVRMADKPVLVSVTWAHTIFRFFETFCEDVSRNKLCGKKKSYFLDLQIKSYGCLKFQGEVWAGRACTGANQQELTTCAKSGGQEEKNFQEKWEQPDKARRWLAAGDQRSPAGRGSTLGPVGLSFFFFN